MQKINKKSITILIALILVVSSAVPLFGSPAVNAQTTQILTHPSHVYTHLSANPIGVGQSLQIFYRVSETNPLSSGLTPQYVWEGFTVVITKPDGTVENKGSLSTDATGGSWFSYTPNQVGNYTIKTIFPGQWINGSYRTVGLNGGGWSNSSSSPLKSAAWFYEAGESLPITLVVQQDPVQSYPNVPLPTEYWTRPIYGENKGWYTIGDNWLMPAYDILSRPFQNGAAFAPYTSGPKSPHILWAKPITFGGIAGGPSGDRVMYTGLSYEAFYDYKVIINGRLYYKDHGPISTATYGTRVLDLYTGEEIMYLDGVDIDLATLFQQEHPNAHGVISMLWDLGGSNTNGTWRVYDAFSGNPVFTITNVTSGSDSSSAQSVVFGPSGELLAYSITGSGAGRRLILWNSTKAILGPTGTPEFSPALGAVFDGFRGIEWNVSIPDLQLNPGIATIGEGYILTNAQAKDGYPQFHQDAAFPAILQPDSNGKYPTYLAPLWVQNRTDVESGLQRVPRNIQDGVYTMFDEATLRYFGYSISTGQKLWVTQPLSSDGWSVFTYITNQAYGMLYSGGFDGHIRGYNITNGEKVWDYFMGPAGFETPYGHWPTRAGWTIADGKIYATNDDHTPDSVMWRGSRLYSFDAFTGNVDWSISGWMRAPAIVDGLLTAVNSYDNQIYTIGKGPSKTTVTTPKTAITLGQSITIEGTVTDQTSGSYSKLKDTPAISDDSMGAWMEYMYMQKPMPTNATGVQVTIDVLDSNGNYRNIGTVTSDTSGTFALAWKPDIPGLYQINAKFEGTNSYGSSYATTYVNVEDAAPTSAPTQAPAQSVADMYFVPAVAGIVVLIIVGFAIIVVLMLRKRP